MLSAQLHQPQSTSNTLLAKQQHDNATNFTTVHCALAQQYIPNSSNRVNGIVPNEMCIYVRHAYQK